MQLIWKDLLLLYVFIYTLWQRFLTCGPRTPETSMTLSQGVRGRRGGVVVSVLATGPKGPGFEPGQGNFLRAIQIRNTTSFGWKVKLEVGV
jgi:hypothetical protein